MILFQDFKKLINDERKAGDWYYYSGAVEDKFVALKGHGTWLQIYRVDGINYANCVEAKVSEFNMTLAKPFS
jgi:hypothetical protein